MRKWAEQVKGCSAFHAAGSLTKDHTTGTSVWRRTPSSWTRFEPASIKAFEVTCHKPLTLTCSALIMAGQTRESQTLPADPYADRLKAAHEFFEAKVDPMSCGHLRHGRHPNSGATDRDM